MDRTVKHTHTHSRAYMYIRHPGSFETLGREVENCACLSSRQLKLHKINPEFMTRSGLTICQNDDDPGSILPAPPNGWDEIGLELKGNLKMERASEGEEWTFPPGPPFNNVLLARGKSSSVVAEVSKGTRKHVFRNTHRHPHYPHSEYSDQRFAEPNSLHKSHLSQSCETGVFPKLWRARGEEEGDRFLCII